MSLRETPTQYYDDAMGTWRCKRCHTPLDGYRNTFEEHDCKVDV